MDFRCRFFMLGRRRKSKIFTGPGYASDIPGILGKLLKAFTAQKMKFSIKNFFSKFDQFPADLVTFTEEILNRKFHFLCSVF